MGVRILMSIALAFTLVSTVSEALAAPHGIYRTFRNQPSQSTLNTPYSMAMGSNLQYYGGPVISNAKVFAVYWSTRVNAATQAKMGGFLAAVIDSTYMDWLSIYNTNITAVDGRQGTNQTIGRGSFIGEAIITPSHTSNKLDDKEIQDELDHQIDIGALPKPDNDTLFMVFFPPGVQITIEGMKSCNSFCAYHEGFVSQKYGNTFYGVMPDLGGSCSWGCGGSSFDSLTFITSHELIEAVTDPFPTPGSQPAYPQAWNTADGSEIADVCSASTKLSAAGGSSYRLSTLWDNRTRSCAAGPYSK